MGSDEKTMTDCPGCDARYNSKGGQYSRCYSCQQEQRQLDLMSGAMVRCTFCLTPHGTNWDTCFKCRPLREKVGADLQTDLIMRDGYTCRACGASMADGATLRVQSLKPDRTSTAPWRFASFCLACASMSPPDDLYRTLVEQYCTKYYGDLDDFQRETVAREAEGLDLAKPGLEAYLWGLVGGCGRCGDACHVYELGGSPVCRPCRGLPESGFEALFRGHTRPGANVWVGSGEPPSDEEVAECLSEGL